MKRCAIYSALLAALVAMPVIAAPPAGAKITPDGWFAPPKAQAAQAEKPTRVVVIPVSNDIGPQTFRSIRTKLKYSVKHKADLVILDMDVSDGVTSAALEFSHLLKTEMRDLRTVCFIRTRALWGGVFVAMACDEIVMTPIGKIGTGGVRSLTDASGKKLDAEGIESISRTDLAESAGRVGKNVALAEKLVSAGREAWLIRNKSTRKLRYVRAFDWRGRVEIPPGIAEGVSNDQADWTLVRIVAPKGEILTLLPAQAAEYGLVDHIVEAPTAAPYANLLKLYDVTGKPVVLDTDDLPKSPFAAPTTQTSTKPSSRPDVVGATRPGAARVRAHARPSPSDTGGKFAEIKPSRKFPPLPAEITKAFILTMRASENEVEPISGTTYQALRRKAVQCRAKGAQLIIIDMHTWGGGVIAALDIARLIKHDLAGIYVVCYVRTRAISAGALIALACDEIVMTPTGKIGDCAPIVMGGKLEGTEREKIETVLRGEFSESAQRGGYSVALAESMVSIHREVWKIRNKRTDEMQYVLRKDWRGKVFFPKGKVDGASNPQAEWELIEVTVPEGELLTMDPQKAVTLGIVSTLIDAPAGNPYANILKEFNVTAPPVVLTDTWSEVLVGWLTSPAVVSILMLFGIMGVYVEIRTPGLGLPGLLALICFGIIFGSQFLIGLATWWEIALFVVGIVLICLEVFVIPGFGVAGVSGIICCVLGLTVMFVDNAPGQWPIPRDEFGWDLLANGIFAMACAFIGSVVLSVALARYFRKIPLANRLCLAMAAEAVPQAPVVESSPVRRIQVGDRGVVESMCRPVGKVRFGEDLVDAVSQGGPIDAGTPVRVLAMESNRPIVERDQEAG